MKYWIDFPKVGWNIWRKYNNFKTYTTKKTKKKWANRSIKVNFVYTYIYMNPEWKNLCWYSGFWAIKLYNKLYLALILSLANWNTNTNRWYWGPIHYPSVHYTKDQFTIPDCTIQETNLLYHSPIHYNGTNSLYRSVAHLINKHNNSI